MTATDARPFPLAARFDALLFDMDGVLTDTATVHARAWTRLFDDFLRRRARERGEAFRPFEAADYARYVDGKRRLDGIESFLASRSIVLPRGDAADDPDAPTVHGLGKRKNRYFREALDAVGPKVFDDAVAVLDAARAARMRLAVVSASENCRAVLASVGLLGRFDAAVTGIEAAASGLRGKPAPDTFLAAAALLGVPPPRAVVLEDAVSGVEAGRAGGFGLVVGVDRGGAAAALRAGGAHVVVGDLRTLMGGAAASEPREAAPGASGR